jgi:hypothetical protein
MSEQEFTPQELALIERIKNAPQPTLGHDAFERLRAQVIAEVDALPPSTPPSQPGTSLPAPTMIVIAVMVVVIIVSILILTSTRSQAPQPTQPPSATGVTATPASPTTAPTLSATPVSSEVLPVQPAPASTSSPTAGATLEPTHMPQPTSESTAETTPEETPPVTATGAGAENTLIVLEGPVQSINVNVITVFDVQLQVNPDDPILANLHIGDNVHVEGRMVQDGDVFIVVVVNITRIDVAAPPSNPPNAGPLPANCKISKNGKIKCAKEHDD